MASSRLMATIDLQDRLSAKLAQAGRNVERFGDKVRSQEARLGGITTAAERAGGALLKIGGAAVAGGVAFVTAKFVALKAAVTGIGLEAFKTNTNMESMAFAMKALYQGDTKAYQKQFKDMVDFAQHTTSQLPQVFQASIGLKGLGMDVNHWLPILDDLQASTGGRASMDEALNSIRYIKSGVYGEGFESLARVFNISRQEFKAMGLEFSKGNQYLGTSQQALDALEKIMEKRGFKGLGQDMANTTKGILSNIGDVWTKVSMALMGWDEQEAKYRDGGLFNQIRNSLKSIMDWASKLADDPFLNSSASIGDKLHRVWENITGSLQVWYDGGGREVIQKAVQRIGEDFSDMLMAAFTGKSNGNSIFSEIGKTAADAFVKGFKENFSFSKILNSDRGHSLAAILAGGAALKYGPGLFKLASSAGGWVKDQGGISGLFGDLGKLSKVSKAEIDQAGKFLGSANPAEGLGKWDILGKLRNFRPLSANRLDTLKSMNEMGMFGKAGEVLGKAALPVAIGASALQVAMAKPSERGKVAFEQLGGLAGGLVGAKAGVALGAALGSVVPGIGTAIGGVLGGLIGGLVGMLAGERFMKAFREHGLAGAVGAVFSFLGQILVGVVQWTVKIGGAIVQGIGMGLAWGIGLLTGAVENMWHSVVTFWKDPNRWTDLGAAIKGWFSNLLDGIWTTLKDWWAGLKGWWSNSVEKVASAFHSGETAAGGTATDNATKTVTLPVHHKGGIVADEGVAILKRKEMVLDPALSDFIRSSASRPAPVQQMGNGPVTVQIGALANTVHVREEADISKVASELADNLRGILGNRGKLTLAEVAR